jgi:hypothetical protein
VTPENSLPLHTAVGGNIGGGEWRITVSRVQRRTPRWGASILNGGSSPNICWYWVLVASTRRSRIVRRRRDLHRHHPVRHGRSVRQDRSESDVCRDGEVMRLGKDRVAEDITILIELGWGRSGGRQDAVHVEFHLDSQIWQRRIPLPAIPLPHRRSPKKPGRSVAVSTSGLPDCRRFLAFLVPPSCRKK